MEPTINRTGTFDYVATTTISSTTTDVRSEVVCYYALDNMGSVCLCIYSLFHSSTAFYIIYLLKSDTNCNNVKNVMFVIACNQKRAVSHC